MAIKSINKITIQLLSALVLIGLFQGSIAYSQQVEHETLRILIRQVVLPGPNPIYSYLLQNDSLSIQETTEYYGDSIDDDIIQILFRKQIDNEVFEPLSQILNLILNFELDSIYTPEDHVLDGVRWEFEIRYKGFFKKSYLDNYYLSLLDRLLICLNKELPYKYQFVTFDILGIKKRYVEGKE